MFTCARKLPQNSSTFAGRTPAVSGQAGGTQTETRQQLTQSPGPLCVTQQVVSGAPDVQVGDGGGGDVGGKVSPVQKVPARRGRPPVWFTQANIVRR